MDALILSPILFPLLGLLINVLWGKRMSEQAIGWTASFAVIASFIVSLALFLQLNASGADKALHAVVLPWIAAGSLNVSWGFLVDPLSSVMMLVVTGVGALIHIYSIGYMHGDERFQRFFVYLNLFVASMLVLVMADNFLVMFVGWELVGLCSYLLIGFWFKDIKNAAAGRKAFIANRVGDVGFVLGVMLIFATFGSLNFETVFEAAERREESAVLAASAIALLLFIGATGKSAQIPLFVWLPDAMAGPTPVSALIHAATMVTAGVYMMSRAHALFELAPAVQTLIALIGGATALVAGSSALRQMDIKKVLAYSTISQLGFMVAAAGLGVYVASLFHLVTHAFFKALLFLAAGSVIHALAHGNGHGHSSVDPQDMRAMGGLWRRMPITFASFAVGGLALAGLPPLSGFFSKDEILLAALTYSPVVFALLAATAVFTALYVGRQLVLVFFGAPRSPNAEHAHESPVVMIAPLVVLIVLAAIGGLINLPGGGWLHRWLEPVIKEVAKPLNVVLAAVFTLLALGAIGLAWTLYRDPARAQTEGESALGQFLQQAWRFDALYAALVVKPFYAVSTICAQVIDVGLVDAAVNAVGSAVRWAGARLRQVQTGFVRSYGLIMLVGVVALLAYFVIAR
ncbi:MAG: NADH-quinone oxidoreductase subunit L [Anaerolineae bacterium]|nr:NADH-quinone oxidoreductase subunit L [Anaerolineae bacterium]